MLEVPELSDLDVAFGGKAMQVLPKVADIPKEYPDKEKWTKVMNDWFFVGMKNSKWKPRQGVDTPKALRAAGCVLRSFEPKHEHKEAGVAYLLSQWFEDVEYEIGKGAECC